uniref:GrpE protein homolog n=1 Tax=Hanusia phi TaxID=3032 RepID=A0A7S0E9L6_9CRYP|mmetsp:Transcript_17531/g.39668  ORF Transcript_17531/g.39668 Transcript_17531/m.39668 type:complete len:513 (+) Transcript_17531:69-1607(+)
MRGSAVAWTIVLLSLIASGNCFVSTWLPSILEFRSKCSFRTRSLQLLCQTQSPQVESHGPKLGEKAKSLFKYSSSAVQSFFKRFQKNQEEEEFKDRQDLMTSLSKMDSLTGEFSILVSALHATGLSETLSASNETLTLFAPSNSAFNKLPKDCLLWECIENLQLAHENRKQVLMDELKQFLLGSVVRGRWSTEKLNGKYETLTSVRGRKIVTDLRTATTPSDYTDYVLDEEIKQKVKKCNAVIIYSGDLQCKNGVIHIVDSLLDGICPVIFSPTRISMNTSAYPELRARGVELELRVREIRARYQELDDEIRPLNELVQDKKLTRPSCKELSATYERLSTDFQNFQTRTEQEIALARESAAADVTTSLMKVLDSLERAESSFKLQTDKEKEIVAAYKEVDSLLLSILEQQGVATIESLGQKFDPLKHEAVSQRPSSEHPDGFVSEQFQRGYVVGKRVVRPALVVVSSGPEATAGVSEEEVGVESAKDGAETETDKDQQTGPTDGNSIQDEGK